MVLLLMLRVFLPNPEVAAVVSAAVSSAAAVSSVIDADSVAVAACISAELIAGEILKLVLLYRMAAVVAAALLQDLHLIETNIITTAPGHTPSKKTSNRGVDILRPSIACATIVSAATNNTVCRQG
jgi:hypothetical protein